MPRLETSTIRPGLLVSLSISVSGGITYHKRILEPKHIDAQGRQKKKWVTEREVMDPVEMEAAWAVQAKARSLITAVCSNSAFGLLCPEADADKLAEALTAARAQVDTFNATATLSRVRIYQITGRVAQDDVEAVRAINSEIRGLLDEMKQGVADMDVEVIRKAANRAKSVGAMLSSDAAEKVAKAIDAARSIARKIVKAGEAAAVEIDQASLRQITEARTTFLDLSEAGDIAAPAEEGRTVELPAEEPPSAVEQALGERVEPAGPSRRGGRRPLTPTPLEEAIERTRQPRRRRAAGE